VPRRRYLASNYRALLRRIFDIVPIRIRDTPRAGALVGDSSPLMFLLAPGELFVPTFFGFCSLFLLSLEFLLSLLDCHCDSSSDDSFADRR
jgi:hypothetical protein